jgi:hypothetical protein
MRARPPWLSLAGSNDVRKLMQQVALAIALALGGRAGIEPPEAPRPLPNPLPATASEAPPAAEASNRASEPDASAVGPALAGSIWLIGDTGTLPSMGWGLSAGFELGWPGFELLALGTLLPEREGRLDASDPGCEPAFRVMWQPSAT